MLKVNQVIAERDNQLFHYDVQLEAESILLISGPSGQGKSTLLDVIAGYLPVQNGTLTWQNNDIAALPATERPVTSLFQGHNLFDHLTVAQNLSIALAHISPQERLVALRELDMDSHNHKLPAELSGGQRQRIAIICALLRPEPLVLLDEPFRELDPVTRKATISWCLKQKARLNKTLVLVSHNREDGLQIAKEIPHLQEYVIEQTDQSIAMG